MYVQHKRKRVQSTALHAADLVVVPVKKYLGSKIMMILKSCATYGDEHTRALMIAWARRHKLLAIEFGVAVATEPHWRRH